MKEYDLNCSSKELKDKLDSLKVVNTNKENDLDLVCIRTNNKFKLSFYERYSQSLNYHDRNYKSVNTTVFFQGEIIEDGDKCKIRGKCKFSGIAIMILCFFIFVAVLANLMFILSDGFEINTIGLYFLLPVVLVIIMKYALGTSFDKCIKQVIKELEQEKINIE